MYRLDLYFMEQFRPVLSEQTNRLLEDLLNIDGIKAEVLYKEHIAENQNYIHGYLTDEQVTYLTLRHTNIHLFITKCTE